MLCLPKKEMVYVVLLICCCCVSYSLMEMIQYSWRQTLWLLSSVRLQTALLSLVVSTSPLFFKWRTYILHIVNPAAVSAVFQDSCFSVAVCTVLLSECHAWYLCSCFCSCAYVYVIMKWQSRILFMEPHHWKYKYSSYCLCIPHYVFYVGKTRWLINGDVQVVNRVFKQNFWNLLF